VSAQKDPLEPLERGARAAFRAPFAAVLRLEAAEAGPIWIDGREDPPKVSRDFAGGEADCVWRASREALLRLLSGKRAFETAYLAGRVAVSGDMAVMARVELDLPR